MIATEPVETIHIYYEREEEKQPKHRTWLVGVVLCFLYACGLCTWIWFISLPVPPTTLRVPARFFTNPFTTSIPLIPTGRKQYPPRFATGILTVYNGSIVSQILPQGLILTGNDGVEIVTDSRVIVPAGNAPLYGVALVLAHAVVSGTEGNIPPLAVYQVYGDSLYIRNLTPFRGGENGYSVPMLTTQDIAAARLAVVRIVAPLSLQTPLKTACRESERQLKSLLVTWVCTYATYTRPKDVQVLSARVEGRSVLLQVKTIVHSYPVIRR